MFGFDPWRSTFNSKCIIFCFLYVFRYLIRRTCRAAWWTLWRVIETIFSTFSICFQIFDTSDLPGGVVNILTGDRDHLTKYLTEHQDIQSMWYFGSAEGSRFVEYVSAENVKRTWVNYGYTRDWMSTEQGQSEEFLYQSIQAKNIWIPMGDIYAN